VVFLPVGLGAGPGPVLVPVKTAYTVTDLVSLSTPHDFLSYLASGMVFVARPFIQLAYASTVANLDKGAA
jgi:hypothetical protein